MGKNSEVEIRFLADGRLLEKMSYSLPADKAVVAAYMQLKGDYNTWDYPTPKQLGVRKSSRPGTYWIEAPGDKHIMAYPSDRPFRFGGCKCP